MISLSNLTIRFLHEDVPLFNNFSLDFDTGTTTAVMGVSGTGKTTLLNAIAGISVPNVISCGLVSPDGLPGYVFQESRLFPWYSVLDNVSLPLYDKLCKKDARDCAFSYLEKTGIASLVNKKPGQISGGERQRVAISRALAWARVHGSTLLLDEPFQGLDFERKQSVMELVKSLVQENKDLTSVLVTHDPREALFLADRLVVLAGRPVSVVYDSPHKTLELFGTYCETEQVLLTMLHRC